MIKHSQHCTTEKCDRIQMLDKTWSECEYEYFLLWEKCHISKVHVYIVQQYCTNVIPRIQLMRFIWGRNLWPFLARSHKPNVEKLDTPVSPKSCLKFAFYLQIIKLSSVLISNVVARWHFHDFHQINWYLACSVLQSTHLASSYNDYKISINSNGVWINSSFELIEVSSIFLLHNISLVYRAWDTLHVNVILFNYLIA